MEHFAIRFGEGSVNGPRQGPAERDDHDRVTVRHSHAIDYLRCYKHCSAGWLGSAGSIGGTLEHDRQPGCRDHGTHSYRDLLSHDLASFVLGRVDEWGACPPVVHTRTRHDHPTS